MGGTDHLLKGHNTNNNKNIFSLGYVILILYLAVAKIVLSYMLSYSFRGYFLHGYHAIMGAWPNGCNSSFTIFKSLSIWRFPLDNIGMEMIPACRTFGKNMITIHLVEKSLLCEIGLTGVFTSRQWYQEVLQRA